MKYFVATLAIVAMLAGSSLAGLNPDCKFFVVFEESPADYAAIEAANRIDPGVFDPFTVYFGILDYSSFVTILIKIGVDPDMTTGLTYTSLLPGGLTLGDWETGGISLASTTPITSVVEGPYFIFASASSFALGGSGEIKILDHDDYPRWVVDSNDVVDNYCVWQNGGILVDAAVVEASCFGDTPVQTETWGGIKALYR